MKREILFLLLTALLAGAVYAQPVPPQQNKAQRLKKILGLNDNQTAKVEKIIKESKEKTDKLREEEKSIFEKSQKDILSLLSKEQAEKFKHLNTGQNGFGMFPPPPDMANRNLPPRIDGNFPPPPRMLNRQMPERMHGRNFNNEFERPAHPPCMDDEDLFPELDDLDFILSPDVPAMPDSANLPGNGN